jgi:lysophospholipase
MPILVSDGRAPGEQILSSNATVFEINPFEIGSWDPSLFGFAPLKYMGSNFESGFLGNTQPCISGFDNAGFVMGTSSSLFNTVVTSITGQQSGSGLTGTVLNWLKELATQFGNAEDDIASWSPNPFYKWNVGDNLSANSKNLTLVDGGEDGQNIPLYPLLQQQRAVDVLIAVDSSADTGNGKGWPNGTSLIATYERSKNTALMNGTAFPAIPDINTFINLGLNARPSFFGCDAKNQSAPTPLIVYIPNAPYSYDSNISTATTELSNDERNRIIQNGYNSATMGNSSAEANWPTCLGCAILSRSFDRTGTAIPKACADCFALHCWNGTRDSRPVTYNPPIGGVAAKNISAGIQPGNGGGKKSAASSKGVQIELVSLMVLALGVALTI